MSMSDFLLASTNQPRSVGRSPRSALPPPVGRLCPYSIGRTEIVNRTVRPCSPISKRRFDCFLLLDPPYLTAPRSPQSPCPFCPNALKHGVQEGRQVAWAMGHSSSSRIPIRAAES